REVVREDAEFLDHVQLPDGLIVRRGTDDLAAVVDVIELVALDERAGADAFLGPVVDAAGRELVVGVLPEELAGRLLEAHHDALVALDVRDTRLAVIGADKDLAAGEDRAAVG